MKTTLTLLGALLLAPLGFLRGVLMFAQPSAFIHRAHKWVWGVLGKLDA